MSQILVPGFDPTGQTTITGAQLYQLIALASMYLNNGLVRTTEDSGTTPQPPDAASDTSLQAFLWRRIDQNGKSYLYQWDESVVSDATFLKWVSILSTSVPANSVGTAQLQGNSVTPAKIQAVDFSQILNFPTAMGGDLGGTFPNPVISANAVTASKIAGGTILLTNLNQEVLDAIQGNSTPSGIIVPCAMSVAPAGWLICDGSGVDQVTYATLYSAIGVADNSGGKQWGWPSTSGANATYNAGGTSFKLPDFRGVFLRGANGTTYDNGRVYNTLQAEAYKNHNHLASVTSNAVVLQTSTSKTKAFAAGSTYGVENLTDDITVSVANSTSGGSETRPVNMSVNYIIKT